MSAIYRKIYGVSPRVIELKPIDDDCQMDGCGSFPVSEIHTDFPVIAGYDGPTVYVNEVDSQGMITVFYFLKSNSKGDSTLMTGCRKLFCGYSCDSSEDVESLPGNSGCIAQSKNIDFHLPHSFRLSGRNRLKALFLWVKQMIQRTKKEEAAS